MARIQMYTTPVCPYCVRAKRLLQARGLEYDEIDVGNDPETRDEMMARSGRRTVPQIFIDGEPIGGYDELAILDANGDLGRRMTAHA